MKTESTTMNLHKLDGCRPTPLSNYLKALGILRMVAEQADPGARGFWRGDVFHLVTKLSKAELEGFFQEKYAPTAILGPWNGGCGFYPKDNAAALKALESSKASRFAPYREAIAVARNLLVGLTERPDKGEGKNSLIAACRHAWQGPARAWVDAALVLGADGEPKFPAMWGTGGNDGRLDFTNNFMQQLAEIFEMSSGQAQPSAFPPLRSALWADAAVGVSGDGAIGQFNPGASGGVNGTTGFDASAKVNAWDFILMLEGAVAFASGLSRRCDAQGLPQAAAPFAVRISSANYASAVPEKKSDDGQGERNRGEQWMPLWDAPALFGEVQSLLREGRSQVGRSTSKRGLDQARAVSRLGVSRGISAFERYGYIERNGKAYSAVPLGRFRVAEKPHQRLLDETAQWMDRLGRMANDKNAPVSFKRASRACEAAVFACAQKADARSFQDLLTTLSEAELAFVSSPKFAAKAHARPLPKLSSGWLEAAGEDSIEWRMAQALAFAWGSDAKGQSVSIRHHYLPLASDGRSFEGGEDGLRLTPDQCCAARDLRRDAAAILARRSIWANGTGALSLLSPHEVGLSDIAALLNGQVDEARILYLARALMAVNPGNAGLQARSNTPSPSAVSPAFAVIRLALPPCKMQLNGVERRPFFDPAIIRRLLAGDLSEACAIAYRRLGAVGLRPKVAQVIGTPAEAQSIATALVFPLKKHDWQRLADWMVGGSALADQSSE